MKILSRGSFFAIVILSILFLWAWITHSIYNIPTPACEKTIMVGDRVVVKRFMFSHDFSRNDFIAFHFPMEDTALKKDPTVSYYERIRIAQYEAQQNGRLNVDVRSEVIAQYGDIETKDVWRRTPYLKRCVGMPGDKIQLTDGVLYVNGQKAFEPEGIYLPYLVTFDKAMIPTSEQLSELDAEDVSYMMNMPESNTHVIRLTKETVAKFKTFNWVKGIRPFFYKENERAWPMATIFPNDFKYYHWNTDNFGPVTIPKQGMKIPLNDSLLCQYKRLIEIYEGNHLESKNGVYYINGKQANEYECKMNYYWMMGDNRGNSADSRFWGFLPEDHLIGKATYVLMSSDKTNGGFRSKRFFLSLEGK
jgi:signal peptidase I